MEEDKQSNSKAADTLKTILRLGHEAFAKGDLVSAAAHILNNTRIVLKYDRSCLIRLRDKSSKVIAISNQSEVNQNSEYCIKFNELIKGLTVSGLVELTSEYVAENSTNEEAREAYEYFDNQGEKIAVVPLSKPGAEDSDDKFFWVIEYFTKKPQLNFNLVNLLSLHYREALWYFATQKKKFFKYILGISPRRILFYLLITLIIVSFIRVSQNVVADFELIPYDEVTEYAPYAGIIDKVNFKNGEKVNKGNVVLNYDIKELSYKLMEAETAYEEVSAELDWIKQQSFDDKNQLGKVKILALQQKKKQIETDKIQWYLKNAEIKADIPGTLTISETEKWEGKAVTLGEKLFEIVPKGKIIAEVMVNENDASVLGNDTKITLYLHSKPESPVYGEIESISPKPMLTNTGQFSYIVKMKLREIKPNFIIGMRGVARVSGGKVSLAYYLFKNLVLWWRKI